MVPIFASFFFYLFMGFFIKEYMKSSKTQHKKQQNGVNGSTHTNGFANISLNGGSICYQPVNNNYDGIKTRSMSNGLKTE